MAFIVRGPFGGFLMILISDGGQEVSVWTHMATKSRLADRKGTRALVVIVKENEKKQKKNNTVTLKTKTVLHSQSLGLRL